MYLKPLLCFFDITIVIIVSVTLHLSVSHNTSCHAPHLNLDDIPLSDDSDLQWLHQQDATHLVLLGLVTLVILVD